MKYIEYLSSAGAMFPGTDRCQLFLYDTNVSVYVVVYVYQNNGTRMHDKYCQFSLLDLLQIAWVAFHESLPLLLLLLFDINCSCASQR